MMINNLEKVNINNSEQWLLIRGKDSNAPLILQVQAGPGLPIIPEADSLEELLHLETTYLVAYWDQRGCGKSYNKKINPESINLTQLVDDIIQCARYLRKKFNKNRIIVIGYSIGATLSLLAVNKESRHFSKLYAVGIDINIPAANEYAVEFALKKANEENNSRAAKQAVNLCKKPIVESKIFQKRAKLLTDLGGIKTGSSYRQLLVSSIKNMIYSQAYGLTDIYKTIRGMELCQNALLPEIDNFNLFDEISSIDIPVHFLQGRLDAVAPWDTALKFFEHLKSDIKTFNIFEESAHMPHYEEPEKFAKLIDELI